MLQQAPAFMDKQLFVSTANPIKTVNLEQVNLDDSLLRVQSSSTVWVDVVRLKVDVQGLPKLYADVIKLAKECGAKISYRNKTKQAITDVMADAVSSLHSYNGFYDTLKASWEQKVVKGIFVPASDDMELESLSALANQITVMLYANTPLGKATRLESGLKDIKSQLLNKIGREGSACGMTIYL